MGKFEYNSGNYDKYNSKNPLKRWMVKRLNEKIMDFLSGYIQRRGNNSVSIKILDAGCGEGFISNLIYTNFSNVEIVGLEYTSEALDIARQLNKDITYIQGNIYNMPFENAAFDIVLCMEVLEHLAEPQNAVKELLRVSGNLLIITVPNEPWFCMGNLLVLKNVLRLGNPIDHVNHWTFRGFKKFTQRFLNKDARYDTSFPWSIVYYDKRKLGKEA